MNALKSILMIIMICITANANAQLLKKLGDKAKKAAERTVEKRVERETEKKTDQALGSVFDNKKERKAKGKKKDKENTPTNANEGSSQSQRSINRASDFEPGTILLFEDDFSKDAQGDFPSQWDTNGSGEIVLIEGTKWLRLGGNSTYVPIIKEALPENYTIEFDLLVTGLDGKTSSQAWIKLLLENTKRFDSPTSFAMVELSPCPWISSPGVVEKQENGKRILRNKIGKDYRNAINGQSHISIAVNKARMRVWMNENKLVDVPRLVPEAVNTFKILTKGLRDEPDKDEVYITNFRIGKAGVDNRSKLLTEGKLSTTAIQFESGSDALKSESYTIINEIATVLKDNPEVKIKIIGHTDADGSNTNNMELSKKRAAAVKNAMLNKYGISSSRIVTDGKGETQPVADNTSAEGKANNRRVEFVKL